MKPFQSFFLATAVTLASLPGSLAAGLADIDHVVLLMQENRAFDHYFGTMAGVRGFGDANVQMNGAQSVYHQRSDKSATEFITPWHLNYLGGDWINATQCMLAGSNSWSANHKAYNHGYNDRWAVEQTPWSIGFYKKEDLPLHWALAEGWVTGDMYQESAIASTNPNRVFWNSGSMNVPGSPQNPSDGGNPYIDNNESPGCDASGINCYPLKWKTALEYYEEAGTSWMTYQDADNYDDLPNAWFEQFQKAPDDSPLFKKGVKGLPLQQFLEHAASGVLPEVSYIIGPMQLSEHPPYSPNDGAWFQRQIAEAVMSSPKYNRTALFVSYDETGGWFDHLSPFHSPPGTAGEWLNDPWSGQGYTFAGPGFRVPFYIISPFTRHGGVFTESSDHTSQLLFIEEWQKAKGRNVRSDQIVHWRREHMSNLVNAFDFDNPDFSVPVLPQTPTPHRNSNGQYDGSSYCASRYSSRNPPVPYSGNGALNDMSSAVEKGFKAVRGRLTEGRFLVLEQDDIALTASKCSSGDRVRVTTATPNHEKKSHRFVAHALEPNGAHFHLSTAVDGRFICQNNTLCNESANAIDFKVTFKPSQGYLVQYGNNGTYLSTNSDKKRLSSSSKPSYWQIYSVSY